MKQSTAKKRIIRILQQASPDMPREKALGVYGQLRKVFGKMFSPRTEKKTTPPAVIPRDLKSYEQETLKNALPILLRIRQDLDVSGVMANADSSKFVTVTDDFLWFVETRTRI